jgi:hypothetical protein
MIRKSVQRFSEKIMGKQGAYPIQSQSGRANADVSPRNRPDARLRPWLANKANKKSQEKAKQGP